VQALGAVLNTGGNFPFKDTGLRFPQQSY